MILRLLGAPGPLLGVCSMVGFGLTGGRGASPDPHRGTSASLQFRCLDVACTQFCVSHPRTDLWREGERKLAFKKKKKFIFGRAGSLLLRVLSLVVASKGLLLVERWLSGAWLPSCGLQA